MREASDIIVGSIALLLIIEGILPFVSPGTWRLMMLLAMKQYDYKLRMGGLCSMLIGLMILEFWYK